MTRHGERSMSEYQFIHFQALDRPLSDTQLEFMRGQSTRADVSRWEFTNEYHFGDFHGDRLGMLRNGYDVHLHFANYGIRRLMFRLPGGLPCDAKTFKTFIADYGMTWHADKTGDGGVLEICPEADAGTYDFLEDPHSMLDRIAPVREALMAGDLRALYLTWLACCCYDEDTMEPPVPAGLAEIVSSPKAEKGSGAFPRNGPKGAAQERLLTPFPHALAAMAEFYELSLDLLEVVAERSPPLSADKRPADVLAKWTARQSKDSLRSLVSRLMDDHAATRADVLAHVRQEQAMPAWPMAEPSRTMGELRNAVAAVEQRRLQRRKKAEEAKQRKRLEDIAEDPDKVAAAVNRLVAERTGDAYKQAARQLAELREAMGPEKGPAYVQAVACKLHDENPKRHALIAALRAEGLLE